MLFKQRKIDSGNDAPRERTRTTVSRFNTSKLQITQKPNPFNNPLYNLVFTIKVDEPSKHFVGVSFGEERNSQVHWVCNGKLQRNRADR
jgi:hypothetical protein